VSVFAEGGDEAGKAEEAGEAQRLRGARILLTEDNEINQQIAIELLEAAGATVAVANNGREAVDMLSQCSPTTAFDVVLMDLQMPEMDGLQATTRIRSDSRFASLPIVAMTAHATNEERQRCLAAGMNDHIAKPIDPDRLIETIAQFYKPSIAADSSGAERFVNDGDGSRHADPDLPPIDGLDVRDGLSRVGGNRLLYRKLLRGFVELQGSAIVEAGDAIASGDSPRAERLAHSLKGVAGNLGAKRVHAAAARLEQTLRDRSPAAEVDAARQQAADTLESLLKNLRAALAGPASEAPQPAAATQANPPQSLDAAARLTALLSDFDPGATDFLEANHAALWPLFGAEKWTQFEELVQKYDFAEAQAQLERAVDSFSRCD
jgi:two-component system sensor histidine kinase/response regulator